MRFIRPRRFALLATAGTTALLTLTGCATTTTTVLPVTATTSASPGPVTSTTPTPAKPTTAAPALSNTGTAWPTVIGSMVTYGQWLLANPNPALAGTITEPGCGSDNALTAELQSLVEQNAYVTPSPPTITTIIGPSPSATSGTTTAAASLGGQVIIDIQAVRPAEPVVERTTGIKKSATSGIVELSDQGQLTPTSLRITLILGSDSKWRFCTITDANNPDADAITSLL
jgi:hypothetical protein